MGNNHTVALGGVDKKQFFRTFLRIGLLSFGGPAAQISVMHREIVEARSWLDEEEFLSALSFCMMLPGPEAMQLATYCGWKIRGTSGGLIAGLLFVLPGALLMLVLAALYVRFGTLPLVETLFLGIKSAVVVIVVQAMLRLSSKALKTVAHRTLAVLAFVALTVFSVPFPLVIAVAALFGAIAAQGGAVEISPLRDRHNLLGTVFVCGSLWFAPILVLWAAGQTLLVEIAVFFSKLAVVTFGGAYAVLAYMSQQIVEEKGWLTPEAMLDGLGLAETTLGPLILVTEFVGYVAASPLGPWGGVAGAIVVLWVTFVPCFLWIFSGAPYVDRIKRLPRLNSALAAVSASIVGVIGSLSVWFAGHVFFRNHSEWAFFGGSITVPELTSINLYAAGLSILSAALLFIFKRDILTTLALIALIGVILHLGI